MYVYMLLSFYLFLLLYICLLISFSDAICHIPYAISVLLSFNPPTYCLLCHRGDQDRMLRGLLQHVLPLRYTPEGIYVICICIYVICRMSFNLLMALWHTAYRRGWPLWRTSSGARYPPSCARYAICHMSHVICHMSYVICHM
jgi:hypothetical protein